MLIDWNLNLAAEIDLTILFLFQDEMVKRDYKFYLAFENSLCRDYVTEKFYNPLLYSTVPVVYSGADYETIKAPRHSFIDVRNFSTGNSSPTISVQHRFIICLLFIFN